MRAPLAVFLLWLSACGAPRQAEATLQAQVDGGSDCSADPDCPGGMVCESCGEGTARQCVPGCRTASQCPAWMTCIGPVQCLTCPCAPGWCDLDPCRDVDGDGFVPESPDVVHCPGKLPGDCDDSSSAVHPGGVELCANGLDDDCNGRTDSQDAVACDVCAAGGWVCRGALNCGEGQHCTRGCCVACPTLPAPTCSPSQCRHEGPRDANGCRAQATCVPCETCPQYAPVCGVDYATWQSACLAAANGVAVLHTGECLLKEGLTCEPTDWCGSATYCGVENQRCTSRQGCFADADCRLVLRAPVCDAGVAQLKCVDHRCVVGECR